MTLYLADTLEFYEIKYKLEIPFRISKTVSPLVSLRTSVTFNRFRRSNEVYRENKQNWSLVRTRY